MTSLKIQYVPAHKDIQGNELADLAAKAAHCKEQSLLSPSTREDNNVKYKAFLWSRWEKTYSLYVQNTGKGRKLFNVKSTPLHWQWA